MMHMISILSGPLIGAVIGYFTNYIAVKMLFHPRNPIVVGGRTLPFTPGIIPKRKKDLAGAIGRAVEGELFGKEDVRQILLGEETRNVITGGITEQIRKGLHTEKGLQEILSELAGETIYEEKKAALGETVTERVTEGLGQMNLGKLIVDKGGQLVLQKLNNPFIAMFISPEMIRSFEAPVNEQLRLWLESDGRDMIHNFVSGEIDSLEQKRPEELLGNTDSYMPAVRDKLKEIYTGFVEDNAEAIVKQFRVKEMIEERVAGMSNEALEELVLSVMANELGMIVNLGAVIGFVIGILNIFL